MFQIAPSAVVGAHASEKERLQFDTKLRLTIVSPVNNCGKLVIRPFSDIYLTGFITAMCPCFVPWTKTNRPRRTPTYGSGRGLLLLGFVGGVRDWLGLKFDWHSRDLCQADSNFVLPWVQTCSRQEGKGDLCAVSPAVTK